MLALTTLAFLAFIGVCSSEPSDCSYAALLTHLNITPANDLLTIMRPVKNWRTPTTVMIDMLLYGILEVDEKSQTLTTHIWIKMTWTNELLTWNFSDFCGIRQIAVPRSRLWIPDIQIAEDASDTSSISESHIVNVYHNGLLMANTRQRLTSTCRLDLKLFPFDSQSCKMSLGSMSSAVDTLILDTTLSDTTLTNISEQTMVTKGEWELNAVEVQKAFFHSNGNQSTLEYTFTISRKPMLYVINLIVPLFYFLILDLASFFISEARGEKLSFKVTVLLSISVLLLILKDMLPSTEQNLPQIASYCVAVFALVGLSVLEAMLVSYLFDLDARCATHCGQEAETVDDGEDIQLEVDYKKEPNDAEEFPQKSDLPLDRSNGRDLLKQLLEEVKAARQKAEKQEKDKMKPGRYRTLAEYIDSVFFTLYFLTVVGYLMYVAIVWVSQVVE
ncbi:5-hydroxytryptamine receptor 3A-like [Centropristis striata]|uniref:5-hydroxytryptamine receptor 3A-like n=1 Tax=Centropristis striata TaxID=184440 RepID=UPI0027DF7918|nr:5-hydroxytryptamine receptor 3A-like [Centropristis striata]